jgi:hypothetical protein
MVPCGGGTGKRLALPDTSGAHHRSDAYDPCRVEDERGDLWDDG